MSKPTKLLILCVDIDKPDSYRTKTTIEFFLLKYPDGIVERKAIGEHGDTGPLSIDMTGWFDEAKEIVPEVWEKLKGFAP